MPEIDYHVLRVGETFDGRLCSEIWDGDAIVKRSFFWPPTLAPKEKYRPSIPHRFLPSSALR